MIGPVPFRDFVQATHLPAMLGCLALVVSGCTRSTRVRFVLEPPSPPHGEHADTTTDMVGHGTPLGEAAGRGTTLADWRCRAETSELSLRDGFLFYYIPATAYPDALPDRCWANLSDGHRVVLTAEAQPD